MSDAAARIPQELIDNIIDSTFRKSDLSSCSLVSRSWLTRSRRNLFAEVNLKDRGVPKQFNLFLAFLTTNNNDSLLGRPVSGFIQCVCGEYCRRPTKGARDNQYGHVAVLIISPPESSRPGIFGSHARLGRTRL